MHEQLSSDHPRMDRAHPIDLLINRISPLVLEAADIKSALEAKLDLQNGSREVRDMDQAIEQLKGAMGKLSSVRVDTTNDWLDGALDRK